ncbi:MAG TPA: arginase [Chromatiaceae bacterium]|jgi:arginase|nr:MAG: hypothetical protein N838_16615 [Thiohalocapsa sp. PB-PSB1]QQO54092.1 MAG: arginase [Thiohalocapsa sp. PB-PSB1]HBG93892.1 arginase [Chromatiaceae bacterium]HCS91873.1 arginase [Chromatiaceae bacterium]
MRDFRIIDICSELGAACLGASLGPDAIRLAARQSGSDFFARTPAERLPERNRLLADPHIEPLSQHARHLRYVLETCQSACNRVAEVLEAGAFPIVLSADHSSAAGVISGIKEAHPDERLGIIWIDAHSDMHSPYTSHSGNLHGMPLGAALGLDDQARRLIGATPNPLSDKERRQWQQLKELGGLVPKVQSENLALIAVRYFKPEHRALIDQLPVRLHDVAGIRAGGTRACIEAVRQQLATCDRLYLSFDVDSLDCDTVSRGTGTPEPDGLQVDEALALVEAFMADPRLCCLEIAEVNPLLDDRGNAMAEAAWRVLEAGVRAAAPVQHRPRPTGTSGRC